MKTRKHGFTLLETAAVLGAVTVLLGVTAPAVRQARVMGRGTASSARLLQIGQGSAMYGADHGGQLFTYTWRPGQEYLLPDGLTKVPNSQEDAAAWQNVEILMRRTGRISGPDKILMMSGRLPHRRLTHLVLMDYMNLPFPSELFADPADANLLQWQANPLDISAANNIPYAVGNPGAGYDSSSGWTDAAVRQRWAYGSSYQRTITAWAPDGIAGPAPSPVPTTPHLTMMPSGVPLADGRNYAEVAFPSAKVHMFEEFDREQAGSPYFAYDHARPEKLMFDGSVNDRPSGEAGPSWNPSMGKVEWRQAYVPLHTFPIPLSGLGETTPLSQRYRWTVGGLKGIDYGAPLMGR